MSYAYTSDYGGGIILAPCLQSLAGEIAQRYPDAVNLGEIGDVTHQGEGFDSDHNPFIEHNGKRYIRAIDIGGPDEIQQALFDFIQARYVAHDPRVWPYGYVHRNNVITTWFANDTHTDAGDVGHLHISVTQANGYHPSPGGWVPALDSTDPWGLITPPAAPPTPKDWFDMATVDDLKNAVRAVLNEGTAHGQKNWAGTSMATLADVQGLINRVNALATELDAVKAKVGA